MGAVRPSAGILDGRKVGAACEGCKWCASTVSCSTIDRFRNVGAVRAAGAFLHMAGDIVPMSRCWLMKSEPNTYSIDDLERDGRTHWDGVRNYQARNLMREMAVGDRVLFYHSNANPPGVVGLARVVKEAYPDHTARDPDGGYYDPKATDDDPRWYMVDIEYVAHLPEFVPLAELKAGQGLEDMVVTKRSRLSVQPVEPEEYEIVCAMGGRDDG